MTNWEDVTALLDAGETDLAIAAAKSVLARRAGGPLAIMQRIHSILQSSSLDEMAKVARATVTTVEERLAKATPLVPVTVVTHTVTRHKTGTSWAPVTVCGEAGSFGDHKVAGLAVVRLRAAPLAQKHEVIRARAEGVEWIYGHHSPKSDEAKALLTAFVLVWGYRP